MTMKYENASEVLPEPLLQELRKYAAGKLLYIPLAEEKKAWGEVSGYRQLLIKRNQFIVNKFLHGNEIHELSKEFSLSEETIKKIVYSRKETNKLNYFPTTKSAKEYAQAGMLEEWLHTYLLFDRRNKAFSEGLNLVCRYYLGPVIMPLQLFQRSSGPEEHMKWKVDQAVFEHRVALWMDKIRLNEELPPLIINYEENAFEINSDNPLFEALIRTEMKKHPIIIWTTERSDYSSFINEYRTYVENDFI